MTDPKEIHDGHMEDYDGQIHDGRKPWRPQKKSMTATDDDGPGKQLCKYKPYIH